MSVLLGVILASTIVLLLGVNTFQTITWARRERLWVTERARLLDTIVAHSASDFRVRQTTKAAQWESNEVPRYALPNERPPRPMPIGLGGGLDAG